MAFHFKVTLPLPAVAVKPVGIVGREMTGAAVGVAEGRGVVVGVGLMVGDGVGVTGGGVTRIGEGVGIGVA